jgi:hypothetical protein
MRVESFLRSSVKACAIPREWSKTGRVSAKTRELIDLKNSIVWMDLEIGATYLKLLAIMEVCGHVNLHGIHESFYSIEDDEIQTAKDDADYLIDICKNIGLKVEELKWCRDGKPRVYRRWPTYGDIVTLPRDWVIHYLSREQEPEEDRRDPDAVDHKYDDRWWKDERDNQLGFEPDPLREIITFKDVWEDRAHEVAEMVETGKARTKCQAVLEIMLDHAHCGEWDKDGNDVIAKRIYFTQEFRNYCHRKWMEVPAGHPMPKPPSYAELTNYCWKTLKAIVSKSYDKRTWDRKNTAGEYAFRRLYGWTLEQMRSCKELSRLEELERKHSYRRGRRAGEFDPDQRMVAEN